MAATILAEIGEIDRLL
ncbi:hypothetical protein [Paenibacillus lignilyticus]